MYSLVTIVKNTVLHALNLLKKVDLNVLTTQTPKGNDVR